MAHSITVSDANTNTKDHKQVSTTHASANKQTVANWKQIVSSFWKHTEDVSKADTSSFEGLL